jgi:hypothetical protein
MPMPIVILQIMWFYTNPLPVIGIGESKEGTESGCRRFQSDQMGSHQPQYRFTTAPKSIIETV